MERIFKIKTKTNPDVRFQYPSERRYSASIVLGLSVVFLQLFLYSVLMGTLVIHKMTRDGEHALNITDEESHLENVTEPVNITTEESLQRLHEKVGKELKFTDSLHYYVNLPALVCAGCFIMALGTVLSFSTGLLAWKRWYVDQNITFFFLASTFSTLTSAICLLLVVVTILNIDFNYDEYEKNYHSPVTFSLAMNIVILSTVGLIWSFLSTKVSFKGMKNYYPDDMVISKGSKTVEVNTIRKGSKNCNALPPDIINHFPVGSKFAKYLPKKEPGDLPKAESNYEYQQRVNKFLSGDPDSTENNK